MTVQTKLITKCFAAAAVASVAVASPAIEPQQIIGDLPVPSWVNQGPEPHLVSEVIRQQFRESREGSDYAVSLFYLKLRFVALSCSTGDVDSSLACVDKIWEVMPIETRMSVFVSAEQSDVVWDSSYLGSGSVRSRVDRETLAIALSTYAQLSEQLKSMGGERPVRVSDIDPDLFVMPGTDPHSIDDLERREAYISVLEQIPLNIAHNQILESMKDMHSIALATLPIYISQMVSRASENERSKLLEILQDFAPKELSAEELEVFQSRLELGQP